jgi:hypothetical protein
MKKIYLFLCFSIFSFALTAQTVNIISNPGTSGNIIIGGSNYHVSESIFLDSEIGPGNFISAGSAIEQINFFINLEGAPTTVNNFKISMKNVPAATTSFTSGVYSAAGYTEVFNGTYNATSLTGIAGVTLTTPFVRTPGTNLQILIERTNNVLHTGNSFFASVGNETDALLNTTRRYNNTTAPTAGVTSLTASTFRPAIQLIHTFPTDVSIVAIGTPAAVSCYDAPQLFQLEIANEGTSNIAAGSVAVRLASTGANIYSTTLNNTTIITPGSTEVVDFPAVNIPNAGANDFEASVTLAGDGTTYNDSAFFTSSTASTLGTPIATAYPIIEDAETTLPVFSYVELVNGDTQLWTLQTGNYTNTDQTVPLVPRAPGTTFYLFDSYSGAGSDGFISRLYSNCIKMPSTLGANPAPVTTLSFWMSHDNIFSVAPNDFPDSLYVNISTDKGLTWTRLLPGYRRSDVTALAPLWRQELVDISAYNGQTIQIGFEGVSKWGNAFGLDDITISYSGLAPVTLLNFDARRSGNVNNLNWSTSQEQNSSRFAIERSIDGRNFSEIGTVAATGNSNVTRNYRFTDLNPVKGINYYRLRIIDNNGTFKYSDIKNVRNLGVADMVIAPNPVQQTMKLTVEAEKAERVNVTITDLSGKRIYSEKVNVVAGTNFVDVPVNNFAKGSYIVTIQFADQNIVKKFNKL